eukprot:m.216063 g.216063  ORF g.216063 m.216063 type:complete len:135 (+) comp44456_c0_seq1:117-521(+)
MSAVNAHAAAAEAVLKTASMDALAKEWLGDSISSEMQSKMAAEVLPTVMTALERLLREVQRRGLVEADVVRLAAAKVNPVNFLAQQLMRHNPQHSPVAPAKSSRPSLAQQQQPRQSVSVSLQRRLTAASENAGA